MLVKAIVPRGYCKGVIRAINIAKEASQEYKRFDIFDLLL